MEKELIELLSGVDVFGLPLNYYVHSDTRDNNLVGYGYLQTILLLQILEELKKLNKDNDEKEDKEVKNIKVTTKKEENKEAPKK